MNKGFININLSSNCLGNTTVCLRNKCNKVVYKDKVNLGKVKLPICNKNIYKLEVCSLGRRITIPIYAVKGKSYNINLDTIENKSKLKKILIKDSNYNLVNIKEGEITIWQ